jgi:hypothetical protein
MNNKVAKSSDFYKVSKKSSTFVFKQKHNVISVSPKIGGKLFFKGDAAFIKNKFDNLGYLNLKETENLKIF